MLEVTFKKLECSCGEKFRKDESLVVGAGRGGAGRGWAGWGGGA